MPITIPDGINHLQNVGTEMYLDIHGPGEQKYAHQWSLHTDYQGRWLFQRQSDGYYTIRSQYGSMYYLGISSSNTGENNIVLSETISDNTRWSIYGNNFGVLILEPKNAPGKVLCVPNADKGTELQLCTIDDITSDRGTWQITVEWDVELEGQQRENGCWAASTRMLVKYYHGVDIQYTQEDAFQAAAYDPQNPGSYADAMRAISYYISGDILNNTCFIYNENYTLSEEVLRQYLDDGHVLYISRGNYDTFGDRKGGHAYVISGYTSTRVAGNLSYQFIILDPWPATPPDPWPETPIVTEGKRIVKPYQWIRNSYVMEGWIDDHGIWDGFIAKKQHIIKR